MNNGDEGNSPPQGGEVRETGASDSVTRRLRDLGFISAASPKSSRRSPSPKPGRDSGVDSSAESDLSEDDSERIRPRKRLHRYSEGLKISPYAGKPKQDLAYWLISYQQAAASQGWSEGRMKDRLSSYLTGDASAWCFHRRERQGSFVLTYERAELNWDVLSWDQVKEELKDAFLPADYEVHLREQLDTPQGEQNVVSFFHKKMHICRQLRCASPEAVRAIRKTLRPEYRRYLGSSLITRTGDLLRNLKSADDMLWK